MKYLLIAVGAIAFLVAVVFIIGTLLPRNHTASRTARFRHQPEKLWRTITDVTHYPEWRDDVARVEVLSQPDENLSWREIYKRGDKIPFTVEQSDTNKRLVARISDPGLPFGGTWTFAISSAEGSSDLTITEDGFVSNPVFRFVSHFFMDNRKTMDTYLKALEKHLEKS